LKNLLAILLNILLKIKRTINKNQQGLKKKKKKKKIIIVLITIIINKKNKITPN